MEAYIQAEAITDGITLDSFLAAVENGTYKNNTYGLYSTEYINITTNVINKFKTFSKTAAPTITQLLEAYKTNKEVYDFIVYNMNHSSDINLYKVYKRLYDALMIININNKLFEIEDGVVASNYISWLSNKSTRMYNKVTQLAQSASDPDQYKQDLYEVISNCCTAVVNALDEELLGDMFADMPTETADKVKIWMTKVIKFFMSYKIQILNTESVNKLDYEYNRIKDHSYINALYYFDDYAGSIDKCSIKSSFSIRDMNRASDSVEVNVYYENGGK
jgi:hypothetical protein